MPVIRLTDDQIREMQSTFEEMDQHYREVGYEYAAEINHDGIVTAHLWSQPDIEMPTAGSYWKFNSDPAGWDFF